MSDQIFISYSRKDTEVASGIASRLVAQGYSVFFDQRAIDVGERWREEIVSAVRGCEAVILMLSSQSVQSADVTKELCIAEDARKVIFPIMLGDVAVSDRLAYQLAGLQYEKFGTGVDDTAMERVLHGLRQAGVLPAFTQIADASRKPFFGRTRQLTALENRFRTAVDRRKGAICFVTGDGGTGKSALVEEFLSRSTQSGSPAVAAVGYCNAHSGAGDPFLPFRDILGVLLGDLATNSRAADISGANGHRIREHLPIALRLLADHGPSLIGTLLPGRHLLPVLSSTAGIPAATADAIRILIEGSARKSPADRLLDDYSRFIEALSAQVPLLLAIEDLHWADASSVQLLFHLFRALHNAPVLLLGVYRPNEIPSGRDTRNPLESVLTDIKRQAGNVWIDLDTLEPAEIESFVDAVVDSEANALPREFRTALVQHTGGNALFCTELLREMQDRGDLVRNAKGSWIESETVDWNHLPARTEAVIQDRIARLTEEQLEVLRLASVEGQAFTAELIAGVQNCQQRELIRVLSRELSKQHGLVSALGVERLGQQCLSRYRFLQACFRSYLYEDFSPTERMLLHGEIGRALEKIYEGRTDEIAPQLTWHFDQAGDASNAVRYGVEAARKALRVNSFEVAETLISRGKTLIATLRPGPQRAELELPLTVLECKIMKARRGWSAPEVKDACDRARKLAEATGSHTSVTALLFDRWAFHLIRMELQEAAEIAGEWLRLSLASDDADAQVQSSAALGNTLFWMGQFSSSRHLMESALEHFPEDAAEDLLLRHGQDSRVVALFLLAYVHSFEGDGPRAECLARKALEIADKLQHQFSRAIALHGLAWLYVHLGNPSEAAVWCEELLTVATHYKFELYIKIARMLSAWIKAMQGNLTEGRAELELLCNQFSQADSDRLIFWYCTLLRCQVLVKAGEFRVAYNLAEFAGTMAARYHQRAYEAELLRIKAEAAAGAWPDDPARAGAILDQAIEVAQEQCAPLFLDRATACRNSWGQLAGVKLAQTA